MVVNIVVNLNNAESQCDNHRPKFKKHTLKFILLQIRQENIINARYFFKDVAKKRRKKLSVERKIGLTPADERTFPKMKILLLFFDELISYSIYNSQIMDEFCDR